MSPNQLHHALAAKFCREWQIHISGDLSLAMKVVEVSGIALDIWGVDKPEYVC